MFGVGLALSAITMFILASKLFGFSGGLLSTILYLYAPYHAVQVYIRGAVGEYWAVAFLPLVVMGILFSCFEPKRRWPIIVGGSALAAVILSHTILGFVTVCLLSIGFVVYWTYLYFRKSFNLQLI